MNIGERNELLIKLKLVQIRDGNRGPAGPFTLIESVGFDQNEYDPLPNDFDINLVAGYTDQRLTNIASFVGIEKAPGRSKADVYVNNEGYSVKSLASAPPALVNHTARTGFETACKHMNIDITKLDRLVAEYWRLRLSGRITEDVKNSDLNSPFGGARDIMFPILQYFLFIGTGAGPSNYPADFIIEYDNPLDPSSWIILDKKNTIEHLWDKLIFSLRAKKGMPNNYPNNYDKTNNKSIAIWTNYTSDEYRGALHIRASKS
jgi:hypothetical protein